LTYSVHAASTVLAVATMRSRRNLLDEIDASTLRFVRSRARVADARRFGSCAWALPVGHPFRGGRPVDARTTDRHGVSDMSADRWAPRLSRALVRRHGVRRPDRNGACHNEREESRSGSPRESRLRIAPALEAVKATGPAAKARRTDVYFSACFRSGRWRSIRAAASR
jgi:hypothetical protein